MIDKSNKIPTKNALLAIPVATAKVSGFTNEELMEGGSHLIYKWVSIGMYVGTQLGASASDMAHVFKRSVATGHQGVNRAKARVTLNDDDVIRAVNAIDKEVRLILENEKHYV